MVTRRPRNGRGSQPPPRAHPGGREHAAELEAQERAQHGMSRAIDFATGRAAQAEAANRMSPDEAASLMRARSGDDTELFPYTPTPSINPPRPRTLGAGYSRDTKTLRVKFRTGAVYEYYDVPPNVWANFQRVKSPGKAVNRTLNDYSYARRMDLES